MAVKMLKQAIDFTCEVAQGNLVNRGVDSLFDSLSGKHNSDSDIENMEINFRSLMARAHDLLTDIRTKEQGGIRKRKKEVEVWFEGVEKVEGDHHAFQKGKGLMKQIFCGDEAVMKLNERIRELVDQSRHFGELVVGDDNTSGLPRPTSELEGAAFQDNFQRIWELLENDQVSSIGVYGMGGVGKSTLVENIYNQLLEKKKRVFWVVVSSQRCSIKMLQDKIARKLDLDLSKEDDDVGARAGRLKHALSHRENFVLILDDMWECFDLKKVGVPLSMKGCKWMMTSRSLNVCREMNCQEKIAVKPLCEDEGWNLFLKNLGQDAISTLRDPEVERTAKSTVGICDGLPLGIITLAGALSGATEIQEWRHALRVLKESAMGHQCMEEKVFPILKYSFDRLNPNDQRCFLYCSLYPEDYRISIWKLLNNLISEKLVDENKSRGAQRDEGHSIVNRLVKVSLLEITYDLGEGEFVKMHDLVRGMAHKITKGKTMVIVGQDSLYKIPIEKEWTKDLEKVSLMMNGIKEIPDGISPHCPKLTTLLLQGNESLTRIANSFFWQMCGIHTLNLSHTWIEELPNSVSELVNLTSLLLQGCEMLKRVPCVRKLKKLRELDLRGTSIEDVPEGMEELRLQLLSLPYTIEAELVEGEAERLELFEGRLKHVTDFNSLFASKQDLVSYTIAVGDYNDEKYYKFQRGGDRRDLYAYNLKGREGNGLTTILAADILHLGLHCCEGMSKCLLDDLTNPISLKKLRISSCKGLECLLTYDQFKAPQHDQSKSRFQALKLIELYDLEEFMGVIHGLEIEDDPPPSSLFSSLRSLDISRCNKMKKLGLPLSIFKKLVDVSISYCEEIEEIIQVDDDDDSTYISLPNLQMMYLSMLPSLKRFCSAPTICNLLKDFRSDDCPILEEPFFLY